MQCYHAENKLISVTITGTTHTDSSVQQQTNRIQKKKYEAQLFCLCLLYWLVGDVVFASTLRGFS